METKKHIRALAVLVLAAFASCAMPKPGDIRLDRFYGAQTRGASLAQSRIVLELGMVNDSHMSITMRGAELHFFSTQGEILEVLSDTPVSLPRRSTTRIEVPLTLRFKGGLGALTALPRLAQDPEHIRVSGTIRLRGGISKTYQVRDEPMLDFLESLGVDPEEIF